MQSRQTYLTSSNFANTAFYESHGFSRAAAVTMGDDDSTWEGPPFEVLLVCHRAWQWASQLLPTNAPLCIDGKRA